MKNKSQTVRVAFWVLLGIAILISSLAFNRPSPAAQNETSTSSLQAGTIVATEEAVEEDVGSTDGIMFVAAIIVLIIISPILLKRKAWSNGKGKK